MLAEGITAALSGRQGILPIAATSAEEATRWGGRADAVALDQGLIDVEKTANDLRKRGVRVVLFGEGSSGAEGGVQVSTGSPVEALAAALVPGCGNGRTEVGPPARLLTPREREVLSLVARGFAGKQVASHLGISPKTVERHKTRIFAKLEVPNQAAAVSVVLAAGRSDLWTLART
jgi:DNA-binding CsgD family transcriptional regulator